MLKRAAISKVPPFNSWGVDLPTREPVPGTFAPLTAGVLTADGPMPNATDAQVLALPATVVVDLPDNTPLDAKGQIDKKALAAMYDGTRYSNPAWVPPVLADP